jgi:hypothetical protein
MAANMTEPESTFHEHQQPCDCPGCCLADPPTREQQIDRLLSFAFDELLWISENPNRFAKQSALQLAVRAREAISLIEQEDPGEDLPLATTTSDDDPGYE